MNLAPSTPGVRLSKKIEVHDEDDMRHRTFTRGDGVVIIESKGASVDEVMQIVSGIFQASFDGVAQHFGGTN